MKVWVGKYFIPVINLLQEESGVDVYRGIHIIQTQYIKNT
jgi:hypothetical protein